MKNKQVSFIIVFLIFYPSMQVSGTKDVEIEQGDPQSVYFDSSLNITRQEVVFSLDYQGSNQRWKGTITLSLRQNSTAQVGLLVEQLSVKFSFVGLNNQSYQRDENSQFIVVPFEEEVEISFITDYTSRRATNNAADFGWEWQIELLGAGFAILDLNLIAESEYGPIYPLFSIFLGVILILFLIFIVNLAAKSSQPNKE